MERLLKNLYRSSIHVCLRIKCCSFPYQLFSYCLQLSPICFMQHLSILQEMLEPSQKGLVLEPQWISACYWGLFQHIRYHCIIMLKFLCTTDLPSSSSFNGCIIEAREGMHMVGWCILIHLNQLGQLQTLLNVNFAVFCWYYGPYRLPIPQPRVHMD
jgi:hypothetical protein